MELWHNLTNGLLTSVVLMVLDILDPTKVPRSDEELVPYGQDKIDHIIAQYGEGEHPDIELMSEWEGLKWLLGEKNDL